MRAVAAGVHHALGNALVVEVEDLLAEMKVLEGRRSTRADLQRILIVRDRPALRRRENGDVAFGDLMQLAALSARELLIVDGGRLGRRLG